MTRALMYLLKCFCDDKKTCATIIIVNYEKKTQQCKRHTTRPSYEYTRGRIQALKTGAKLTCRKICLSWLTQSKPAAPIPRRLPLQENPTSFSGYATPEEQRLLSARGGGDRAEYPTIPEHNV